MIFIVIFENRCVFAPWVLWVWVVRLSVRLFEFMFVSSCMSVCESVSLSVGVGDCVIIETLWCSSVWWLYDSLIFWVCLSVSLTVWGCVSVCVSGWVCMWYKTRKISCHPSTHSTTQHTSSVIEAKERKKNITHSEHDFYESKAFSVHTYWVKF